MAPSQKLRTESHSDNNQRTSSIFDLPNEILVHILDCLQTQCLLQSRPVSHRFQNLIIRIVHNRLLRAASLRDRKLILECYHPSAQYTEPILYCDYLGTPGLSDEVEGQGEIYEIADHPVSGGTLRRLYSRFRPTRKEPEPNTTRPHPAGDIPGTRTSKAAESSRQAREAEVVARTVSLEAHELFSQLCFSAGLVQLGPRKGVFLSNVDIVEKKYFRIWRKWLAEKAKGVKEPDNEHNDRLIWVDQNMTSGFKVRVVERKSRRDAPILIAKDEDQAVSYSMELEELLISTTHLMLAVERSLLETSQDLGKAMIFGSFVRAENQEQLQHSSAG